MRFNTAFGYAVDRKSAKPPPFGTGWGFECSNKHTFTGQLWIIKSFIETAVVHA